MPTAKGSSIAYITYLIYIVLWEGLVFGGAFYAVFILGQTGLWFLLAVFLGGCAYSPQKWIHGKDAPTQ